MKKNLISLALVSLLASNAAVAASYEAGDFVIRGGVTMVEPDSGKSGIDLAGEDSGLTLSVDDNTQLGLNFVYFFDSNWAIEVLAATPFTHDVKLQAAGTETTLAEVTHLPPTVSAVYYFDTGSKFMPYVGAGLNYTIFFDEEFDSTYKDAGFSNLELDGSFGFALQVGADYQLNEKWHINASARYIDIGTDATFDVGGASIGESSVDVDPMVYSLMLGYKF
ncbi:OmpW family outer membrane protein [Thalassotalea nanhaiensis]|uniref:OmpW family outer membrane protein n=1 Tax=Thalassotalea nanhaiensis TaxID=3065648 RepID=A0ABY9TJ07_9GAMM|nr:OmpW family outer membrane protein [Colwelliaceae bacterium SQ345]